MNSIISLGGITSVSNEWTNGSANRLLERDRSFHRWYRFVLSFPPHLVQKYIERFDLKPGSILLDPFCGTGTTLVEGRLHRLHSVGIEANRMAHFASSVKCDWTVDPELLYRQSSSVAGETASKLLRLRSTRTLNPAQEKLLLKDSISPLPLHKTLVLRQTLQSTEDLFPHQLLALATSTVRNASNLHFGPEVGVSRVKKRDCDVISHWLQTIEEFCEDLESVSSKHSHQRTDVFLGDARTVAEYLPLRSVDAVFTSPPYPNEKDYTRTTRLESVLLDFLKNKEDLREMKQGLLRSNSRNIYKDDADDHHIREFPDVLAIADRIESRRLELGKTSGFERLYHRIVRQYFGGMARHLESMIPVLKKGALLGYVVGDQSSFFQIPIKTGHILAEIAESLGYEVVSLDLFRTRFATATKINLNEEVLVLRWSK